MLNVTGQRPHSRTLVDTSSPIHISSIDQLNKAGSDINNRFLSGKKKGTMIVVMDEEGAPKLFVSEGQEATDWWSGINTDSATGDIKPA